MNDTEYLDGLRHRLVDACEGWETTTTAGDLPTSAELHAAQAVLTAAHQLVVALEVRDGRHRAPEPDGGLLTYFQRVKNEAPGFA